MNEFKKILIFFLSCFAAFTIFGCFDDDEDGSNEVTAEAWELTQSVYKCDTSDPDAACSAGEYVTESWPLVIYNQDIDYDGAIEYVAVSVYLEFNNGVMRSFGGNIIQDPGSDTSFAEYMKNEGYVDGIFYCSAKDQSYTVNGSVYTVNGASAIIEFSGNTMTMTNPYDSNTKDTFTKKTITAKEDCSLLNGKKKSSMISNEQGINIIPKSFF
ncbi:MAG: hypothetical protein GY754_03480 [bacterium]|nr:hypothetical protein [bacterium]